MNGQRLQSEGLWVVGEATRSAPPDMVELMLGVQTDGATAIQALRENATKMTLVAQAIVAMGVGQGDIQTAGLSIYPLYTSRFQPSGLSACLPYPQTLQLQSLGLGVYPQTAQPSTEAPQIVGYRVSNSMRVSLRDPTRLGEVLDAAIAAGANLTSGVALKLRDESALRRTALEAAGKDARAKAEALATAVGKQLGDVITVTEEFTSFGQPPPGFWGQAPLGLSGGSLGGFLPFGMGAAPPSPTPGSPGELAYYARVVVVYQLR